MESEEVSISNTTTYSLTDFTIGSNGHWQNTIYIPCGRCNHPCELDQRGCLMTASASGEPILLGVNRYEQFSKQKIVPESCCGTMSRSLFEILYFRYLFWELDHADQCPLQQLNKKILTDPYPKIDTKENLQHETP